MNSRTRTKRHWNGYRLISNSISRKCKLQILDLKNMVMWSSIKKNLSGDFKPPTHCMGGDIDRWFFFSKFKNFTPSRNKVWNLPLWFWISFITIFITITLFCNLISYCDLKRFLVTWYWIMSDINCRFQFTRTRFDQ